MLRLLGKLFQAKFIRGSVLCKERAGPSLMNVTCRCGKCVGVVKEVVLLFKFFK